MRIRFALVIGICAMLTGRVSAQDWDAPPPDPEGNMALAEQFAGFAHQVLRTPKVSAAAWNESVALYRAACALAPTEPRFVRALADTYMQIGDSANALATYRVLAGIKPDDHIVQMKIIDLYLAEKQDAQAKMDYLHQLLNTQQLAAEIRSEVAVRLAALLINKAQAPDALKMLDTAIQLNHLNLNAMRAKYQLTREATPTLGSVMQIMAMLHASPADPLLYSTLAQQLAQLGLVDQSISWYSFAMGLYRQLNVQPDPQFVRGASCELFISNRTDDASKFLDQYLSQNPQDIDSWFVRLAICKSMVRDFPSDPDQKKADTLMQHYATIAISNRFQEVRAAAGDSTATTRPFTMEGDVPLPDVSGDAALLQKAGPQAASNYMTVATSLAWFELYFRHDVAAADPLLNVMGQLLAENDVQLTRLRGWRAYISGDVDGAVTKLSAVSNQDPLAAMGLVVIQVADPAKKEQGVALAQQVISRIPYGPVGAIISGELHPLGVKIEPQPLAVPIATELGNYDKNFLGIISQPGNYYIIRAEPIKAAYEFGEPVLIRVTIQNVGREDIAIGRDCALHPDLWFDAYLRGIRERKIPGAAFDQLSQRMVLAGGQSISTVTRVDIDDLYNEFNQRPDLNLTVSMGVVTNPISIDPTAARPGPCGQQADSIRMLQRKPTPINSSAALDALGAKVQSADGGARIRAINAMGVYVQLLAPQAVSLPNAKAVMERLQLNIRKQLDDKSPGVRAWARYMTALTSADAAPILTQMAQDPDWRARMLALRAAPVLKGNAMALVTPLTSDKPMGPDDKGVAVVSAYATAISQHMAAATTQASDGPASPLAPGLTNIGPVTDPTSAPSTQPAQ